jgi:hypothetical protein
MTETLVPKNYRAIIDQLTKENGFDEGLLTRRCKPFENNELRDSTALAALGR